MTEKEKLDNIKARKDLGINTMIELLMMDDPSLTEKDAELRLKKLLEEKIKNQLENNEPEDGENEQDQEQNPDQMDGEEDEGDESDREQQQDSVGN